jgi:hypothetical protein
MHHLGSLALMHDFSTVFNGDGDRAFERYPGTKRNIAIYKKYDDLRKAQYFSEEYRQKLIDSPYECHLLEKRGGKYSFVEKDYQFAKLYDLNDKEKEYLKIMSSIPNFDKREKKKCKKPKRRRKK